MKMTNSLSDSSKTVGLNDAAPIDTVTVLYTESNKIATKKFIKSAVTGRIEAQSFNAGTHFQVLSQTGVNSIFDLSEVLKYCEQDPHTLIIRGAPVSDKVRKGWVTRTGSGNGKDFNGNFMTPTNGRHYIEIDVDKFQLPDGLSLDQNNTQEICELIIKQLPAEFHEVSYHWQLSSSAGIFDATKVSVHLWFWLASPVKDADLRLWAKQVNEKAGIKLVDGALFQHVQAHYVAAPIFEGMENPFPTRSGLVTKPLNQVDLKIQINLEGNVSALTKSGDTVYKNNGGSGFEYYLGQIGDHAGGDGFHMPIVQAAASYVAEHGTENLDVEELFQIIHHRVLIADASQHSQSDVMERASRNHIMSAITSAVSKFGNSANQRRKSRRMIGLKPDIQIQYQDVKTIQDNIEAMLDRTFLS